MQVALKKVHPKANIPHYATSGSAGFDLAACLENPVIVAPGKRAVIPTGLAIALPAGFELQVQVRGRSGMAAKHGILPANGVGTIDSDYRGEIGVILLNTSQENFMVEPGMRIAQGVIARYEVATWQVVDELDETERASGGYGSTGSA